MQQSPSALPSRFAVATKAGVGIDLHFGHARIFHVYDWDGQALTLVAVRDADQYCTGEETAEETREQTLRRIADTLADVSILLVAKIGSGPKTTLSTMGLTVSDAQAYESIAETAAQLWPPTSSRPETDKDQE